MSVISLPVAPGGFFVKWKSSWYFAKIISIYCSMAKKYRFRKIYFICCDNNLMDTNTEVTNAYQFRETALDQVKRQPTTGRYMWEVNKPPKINRVEGFYLVHESLYELLLKEHSK